MQTLEPALEQLRREEVVGSWNILSKADWRISIRAHANYRPAAGTLAINAVEGDSENRREQCRVLLEKASLAAADIATACAAADTHDDFYALERLAHLVDRMVDEDVHLHVAQSIARRILEAGPATEPGRDMLDWLEIALNVCTQKRRSKEKMRNSAGFIVKIAKDEEARLRLVPVAQAESMRECFRRREQAAKRQQQESEERALVIEYETYRETESQALLAAMAEERRNVLREQKLQALRRQERFQRMSESDQIAEAEGQLRHELAKQHLPPFERWRLRRMARQAVLALFVPEIPDLKSDEGLEVL
jgi:hypothetical protein